MPHIPPEIIAEILSWMPVKSLLRLRCVSKLWRYLISRETFINTHLQNSKIRCRNLLVSTNTPDYTELKHCSWDSLMYYSEVPNHAIDIHRPMRNLMRYAFSLVGYCNGLVCIRKYERHLFLWNPTTRKIKKVPDSPRLHLVPDVLSTRYGFGFDECNDDYKVFKVVAYEDPRINRTAMLYSRKTDSWKMIPNFEGYYNSYQCSGAFVNGKLHWPSHGNNPTNYTLDIVSIDIKTERCGHIDSPVAGYDSFRLGELGGCLSLLAYYETHQGDLWILKEYGLPESWTKVFSIPHLVEYPFNQSFLSKSIFMLNNREILLFLGSVFVVCNLDDKTLKYLRIDNTNGCYDAVIYVESLVSP